MEVNEARLKTEAAYDREASDKTVEGARVRAREKLKMEDAYKEARYAAVTGAEMLDRRVHIGDEKHVVKSISKDGKKFCTDDKFEGELKYVHRRGRGYVYVAPEGEISERVDNAIDEIIDFTQFQRKTIWQCTEEIVPYIYRQPVYLLLQTAWNDALDWANETMNVRGPEGEDTHDFRLGIETPEGVIDYQLSAQDELSAAFKLGQIFHDNLSLETVKLL